MKVEIWSDVVCPFCYIGKRKFENALNTFSHKEEVEIVWRSFQLDPNTKAQPGKSVAEALAEKKGFSLPQMKEMMQHVDNMAKEVGLNYNMDKAVIANTLLAHQLIHFATTKGEQDAAEERLFQAYMIEGKDVGDMETLVQLGEELGLNKDEVRTALENKTFSREVEQDQYEAQQIGVNGVPFFVFNNKYAVSGAQPSDVFTQVLNKVWEEEKPLQNIGGDGGFCSTDGNCN